MPVINITTNRGGGTVTEEAPTSSGDSIIQTSYGSISFISEDISKQISGSNITFNTSYLFKKGSLEVYINGLKMSSGFDFSENINLSSFSLIFLDSQINKVLNPSSCILVKYAKG